MLLYLGRNPGKCPDLGGLQSEVPKKEREDSLETKYFGKTFPQENIEAFEKVPKWEFLPQHKNSKVCLFCQEAQVCTCGVGIHHIIMSIPQSASSYSTRLQVPGAHFPLHLSTPTLGSLFPPPWEQMPKLAEYKHTKDKRCNKLRTLQPQKLSESYGGELTFSSAGVERTIIS